MPRHGVEDKLEYNLNKVGDKMRNWIHSARDRDYCRVMIAALNLRVS